ncbi:hypothetical protein D3C79_755490 [compost metagenome]
MTDQDRPFAAIGLERLAHATEDVGQGRLFADGHAQRVVELDPGELQGSLFDVGAFERLDAEEIGVFRKQEAFFVHADGDRGDLQQGVGCAVETAGLNIDNYWQVTAKAFSHWVARTAAMTFLVVFVLIFAHAVSSSRRQRSCSPARSGITVCSPNGKLLGAVQLSRTRVMLSVFTGRP